LGGGKGEYVTIFEGVQVISPLSKMFYLILKNKTSQRTHGNRRCLTPKKQVYIYRSVAKRW